MNEIHKDEFAVRLEDFKEEIKKLIANQAAPPVNLKQIQELAKKVEEMDNRIKSLKPGDDKININEEFANLSAEEKLERGVTLVVPYKSLVGSVLSGHDEWLSDEQTALEEIERLTKRNASTGEIANVRRVTECPICTKKHTKYETVHNGPSSMINVFTWWEFLDAYVNEKKDKNGQPWIKSWVVFDEAHLKIPIFQVLLAGLRGDRTNQYSAFGKSFHEKIKPFKIVEMSATFSNLPTSKKLSGTITDYYLTSFDLLDKNKHPDIFKRKVIAFCDDLKKIDLEKLAEATKVLVLNEALKLYATDIVKSMEPPLFVIASNDFSVGFFFGDVDVISTGEVMLPIVVKGKEGWIEEPVSVPANSADLLQQRGRAARVFNMTAVWMSLVESWQEYPPAKLKKDVSAEALIQEFAKKNDRGKADIKLMKKDEIRKIVNHYKQEKPIPKLNSKQGNQYLNLILAKDLKNKMNSTLWNVTQEEKDKVEKQKKQYLQKAKNADKKGDKENAEKYNNLANQLRPRNPGEYIFVNPLLEFFKEEQLSSIMVEATKERIARYNTKDLEDDYVFNVKNHAIIVGWLLQCRDKSKCEVKTKKSPANKIEELRIQFAEYNQHGGKISRMTFN